MSEQTQATAIEVVTQEQLQQQVKELQDMLHGYENELNAASDAHNATIDELTKVRAELEGVRGNFQRVQKDLQHTQDMLGREKVRSASYQATIRELEEEIDECACDIGELEHLKQVAKLSVQHYLGQIDEQVFLQQVVKPLLQRYVDEF